MSNLEITYLEEKYCVSFAAEQNTPNHLLGNSSVAWLGWIFSAPCILIALMHLQSAAGL